MRPAGEKLGQTTGADISAVRDAIGGYASPAKAAGGGSVESPESKLDAPKLVLDEDF